MPVKNFINNLTDALNSHGFRLIKKSYASYLAALLCLSAIFIAAVLSNRQNRATAQEREAGDGIAVGQVIENRTPEAAQVLPETSPDPKESVENPESLDLWTNAPTYPILIFDNVVASVGNTLYSFSGASFSTITANSYKFDGTTWMPIAPLPVGLSRPAAVTDGTSIYILGGSRSGGTNVNTLYRYNPAANNYTTLAPSPSATFAPAAAYLNGKIYKIGGYTGGQPSNAVEVYDTASNQWTTLSNYPLSVGWAAAWSRGNFVYVAGGAGITSFSDTEKTYRYDPVTDTWDDAAIADLPDGRWGAALGVFNGFTVLAGGGVGGISDVSFSATVVAWNPDNNSWGSLPDLLRARARVAGGIINGNFYVVGGSTLGNTFTGSTTVQQTNLTVTEISGTVVVASPSNGVLNPGNTVTVNLNLQNSGLPDSGSVTATLLSGGGIISPSAPQIYGSVPGRGGTISRGFSFQIPGSAVCGSQITLTFRIQEGNNSPLTVTQTYLLGARSLALSQNFDAVEAPTLPAGWSTTQSGTAVAWTTLSTATPSFPNAAVSPSQAGVGLSELESPAIPITTANAQISFDNVYSTFPGSSGMVLEISIPSVNGGAFRDILAAGGTPVSGGYNGQLLSGSQNPLQGRQAWTGFSTQNITSLFNLPSAAIGQSVKFKWRLGTAVDSDSAGVQIDDVKIIEGAVCNIQNSRTAFDFDGDGKADISVFRPSNGTWYLQRSSQGFSGVQFGVASDVLTPADYDGDGKTDVAVYRGGIWYLQRSSQGFTGVQFGAAGDLPMPADYDGDGKTDIAVFRPSNGVWYLQQSTAGFAGIAFGQNGDKPVAADYDGDERADIAVFRPSNGVWYLQQSTAGFTGVAFGASVDKPVPADYDGDGRADIAVFRPSNGVWYLQQSTAGFTGIAFGANGDLPVPADYDGDGRADVSVFRPSNGVWYLNRSTKGFTGVAFGANGDKPIPNAFVP